MVKKNLTVVPSGEAKVLDMVKETRQHVSVYDKFGDVMEVFHDIKGYSVNGPYFVVQMKDDTQHVFMTEQLRKITINSTKDE